MGTNKNNNEQLFGMLCGINEIKSDLENIQKRLNEVQDVVAKAQKQVEKNTEMNRKLVEEARELLKNCNSHKEQP